MTCGVSGGCRAAQGMSISKMVLDPKHPYQVLTFPAGKQEHIVPAAKAVRCTLSFQRTLGVVQEYFLTALQYNNIGMESK